MKNIPCPTCIVLAACKAKKQIECEIIYEIIRKELIVEGKIINPVRYKIRRDLREFLRETFPDSRSITKKSDGSPKLVFRGFK